MKKNDNRERLGWAILLANFAIWLVLIIFIPLSVNNFIQNARRKLAISLLANQGTVGLEDEGGQRQAIYVGEMARPVQPPSNIITNATDSALLLVATANGEQLLARLQVYGNSTLEVNQGVEPRYRWSTANQTMKVLLATGRVRITLPPNEGRPFQLTVETPQGTITLDEPVLASIEVNNISTQVIVHSGRVNLQSLNMAEPLVLLNDQRAEIPLEGPLLTFQSTERNLIKNGDFNQHLENWSPLAWNVELADQPQGQITMTTMINGPALTIERVGQGHADVEVRQIINQDITDFAILQLELGLRINNQSLEVCGSLGSECPITVRMEYDDPNGNGQVWQQGFYAIGTIGANTPDLCNTCPPPRPSHVQVPAGQFSFFQLNLLQEMAQQGLLPPSKITSLSLIAAGHSFAIDVFEIALIAQE